MPYKIPVFRVKRIQKLLVFRTFRRGVVKTSKLSENSAAAGSWFIHTPTQKSITPNPLQTTPSPFQNQPPLSPTIKPKIPIFHPQTPYRTRYRKPQ